MGKNSKIEWCDHTVNLWWGCTKVHAGCDNCYAEHLSDIRYKNDLWGEGKPRRIVKSAFGLLDKFQKLAKEEGRPHRVFVGSMMDIFEKPKALIVSNGSALLQTTGDLRDLLFKRISDGDFPDLTFLFLTKRPSNINKYIPADWKENPPDNVWFGCSPVDQATYNNFRLHMTQVNGNTFYSIEPQLGEITLDVTDTVNWIIQGGESGPHRRPFDLAWGYSLDKQCFQLSIPYFFKQIDKVREIPTGLMVRELPFSL